jgi:UPF0042 nucleotide-binding protein
VKRLTIIIITGLSGSGKSTALDAFEDAGFYCVDNLPVALLPKFLELPMDSDPEIDGIAMVMDLREKDFPTKYTPVFEGLKREGYPFKILFLEADEKILLQRYSATRRQHPLSPDKGLMEGIQTEKEQLNQLRSAADTIIDTSKFNVHELKSYIFDVAQKIRKLGLMQINILSFGFKYGIPHEADLIVDVRFLANPYFIPELKALDGESQEIKDFILKKSETRKFLKKYFDLLDYLIPLYEKEGKSYLTIAVGCTGGRHRSVTIARSIHDHIKNDKAHVQIFHRDINQAS